MTDRPVAEAAVACPIVKASALDLDGCVATELCVTLYDHETASLRFESWPEEVRRLMERQIEAWKGRNGERILVAVTTGVARRCCVLILHHKPKG